MHVTLFAELIPISLDTLSFSETAHFADCEKSKSYILIEANPVKLTPNKDSFSVIFLHSGRK